MTQARSDVHEALTQTGSSSASKSTWKTCLIRVPSFYDHDCKLVLLSKTDGKQLFDDKGRRGNRPDEQLSLSWFELLESIIAVSTFQSANPAPQNLPALASSSALRAQGRSAWNFPGAALAWRQGSFAPFSPSGCPETYPEFSSFRDLGARVSLVKP
jgi:hypothetical protein